MSADRRFRRLQDGHFEDGVTLGPKRGDGFPIPQMYGIRHEVADDVTQTFDAPENMDRAIIFVTSDISAGDVFIGAASSSALNTIYAGANVDNGGTTNNDTDTKLNIWTSAPGEISIKNRRGATRRFYMYFLGGD